MRGWLLAALLAVSTHTAADCSATTAELENMERRGLRLTGPEGRVVELSALIADDYRERAAGFQHVCPETVASTAIYFDLGRSRRPSFHMRNVKAPLDIAFIAADGRIVDIQLMRPYVLGAASNPTYSPPVDVAAALETRAGWFAGRGVAGQGWRVEVVVQ